MNEPNPSTEKPRFFSLMGWSWLVMGVLGLMGSLGGLAAIPALEHLQSVIAGSNGTLSFAGQTSDLPLPAGTSQSIQTMLAYAVPFTWAQVFFSIAITAASWGFLRRKNWGRLVLSGVNALTVMAVVMSAYYVQRAVESTMPSLPPELMIVAPSTLSSIILLLTLLFVAPMIWMGWYFHAKKIKDYVLTHE